MTTSVLIDYVAKQFNVMPIDLIGGSRVPYIVRARAALIYALHRRKNSSVVIGRIVKREHSTVLHSLEMLPRYREKCPRFDQVMTKLELTQL